MGLDPFAYKPPKPAQPAAVLDAHGRPVQGVTYRDQYGNVISFDPATVGGRSTVDTPMGPGPFNTVPIGPPPAAAPGPSGPSTRGYTDLFGNQRQNLTEDEILARSITARRMGALTDLLGRGEQRGIGRLKQGLAQRGLMDSGSLGAGISSINRHTQDLLAEGARAGLENEAGTILGMHEAERARQYGMTMFDKQVAAQRALAQYQASMQPSGLEQLLSGLGGAVGTGLGMYAGGRLFPVGK